MNKYLLIFILFAIILVGGIYLLSKSEHKGFTKHQQVMQNHRNYEIEITQQPQANQITLNEPIKIKYKIKNDKGEVIKNFALAHEKLMHFIIVRKDLMQFQHLHPDYDKSTGEFSIDVVFTVDGPYRFFADFTPMQDNPQMLPVTASSDLSVGDVSNFQPSPVTPDIYQELRVLPDYQVTYSFPNELISKTPVTYNLTVEKSNESVNLEKYLGAMGHSVIIKKDTLEYIHTHAGEQNDVMDHEEHSMISMQNGNKIDFTTMFPERGIYKIFTQFQHQKKVVTTEYTVEVK